MFNSSDEEYCWLLIGMSKPDGSIGYPRLRIKIKLDMQLHCVVRQVEDFFFSDYLPDHGFDILIGSTKLVGASTARSCWGLTSNITHEVKLVVLDPDQGVESYSDDETPSCVP